MANVDLILDAQVDLPGPSVPLPGHTHLISITRYRVLRIWQGQYANRFVLVGHDRADMTAPEFQPDTRKRLELTLEFPPHTSQLNPFIYENPGLPVYYCLSSQPQSN